MTISHIAGGGDEAAIIESAIAHLIAHEGHLWRAMEATRDDLHRQRPPSRETVGALIQATNEANALLAWFRAIRASWPHGRDDEESAALALVAAWQRGEVAAEAVIYALLADRERQRQQPTATLARVK